MLVLVAAERDDAILVRCAHMRSKLVSHGGIQPLPVTAADSQPQSALFDSQSVCGGKFLTKIFTNKLVQFIRRRINEVDALEVNDLPEPVFIRFQRHGVFVVGRRGLEEKSSTLVERRVANGSKSRGTQRFEPPDFVEVVDKMQIAVFDNQLPDAAF